MTIPEIRTALDSLKISIDGILCDSMSIIPEQPTTNDISAYSAAITNLSFAVVEIDRALMHIDDIEKGGA